MATCLTCGMSFMQSRDLNDHCNVLGHRRIWTCSQCGKQFSSFLGMHAHQDAVHEKFDCGACVNKSFRNEQDLDQHENSKHAHRCWECGKDFGSPGALQSHNSASHRWSCDRCDEMFKEWGTLQVHLRSSGHYKPFSSQRQSSDRCTSCRANFDDAAALTSHNEKIHNCDFDRCTEKFDTLESLKYHKDATHAFRCTRCDRGFQKDESRQRHELEVHTFNCNKCTATEHSLDDLFLHQALLHEYKCGKCPAMLGSIADLAQHHCGNDPNFVCLQCSATFGSMAAFLEHHATHMPKCPFCPATFKGSKDFQNHWQSAHVFACDKCNSEFDRYDLLQQHIQANHAFKCPHCLWLFCNSEVGLSAHKNSCHNLPCNRCARVFETPLALTKHYQEDHALKCIVCDGTFDDKAALEKHKALTHAPSHNGTKSSPHGHPTGTLQAQPSIVHDHQNQQQQSSVAGGRFAPQNVATPPATPANGPQVVPRSSFPNGEPPNYCSKCNEVFEDELLLQIHYDTSPFHEPPILDCSECKARFPNQVELLRHFESRPHHLVSWTLFVV
jgi:DNA-directed RNA polymerase subunit RPC12/RpoP